MARLNTGAGADEDCKPAGEETGNRHVAVAGTVAGAEEAGNQAEPAGEGWASGPGTGAGHLACACPPSELGSLG